MSSFIQKPLLIDAPMAQSFWATLRSINFLPATGTKPIRVIAIKWNDPGPSQSVVITDGVGNAPNNILFQEDTPADFTVGESPWRPFPLTIPWRDFQVTVLTGGAIEIFYR